MRLALDECANKGIDLTGANLWHLKISCRNVVSSGAQRSQGSIQKICRKFTN